MGTRGGETQDTERHSLTLLPLPNGASRTVHHPTGRGGGHSGGLKGHGDSTGQEASRAAPVLGAMAGQGTRAAMAERGAGSSGGHGGAGDSGGHNGSWSSGGADSRGRSGSADSRGRSGGVDSRGAQGAWTLGGAREAPNWTKVSWAGPADATEGWLRLGTGNFPDTGRYLLSNPIPWCLGDPWGDSGKPRAETNGGWPRHGV